MISIEPRDRIFLPAAVWFVPAAMLLVALGPMPYGFYTLLRWVACGAFLCLAYQEHQLRSGATGWSVLFVGMAILFNPLLPIHLTREAWAPIDAGSAIVVAAHYFVCRRLAANAPSGTRSAASAPASGKPDTPPRVQSHPAPAPGANVPPGQDGDSNALAAKTRLHDYEIVRVLGAGGFGITYLAFDHNLNGPVALKEYFYAGLATRARSGAVVPSSTSKADGFEWGRARFLDEARLVARLDHPNIVRVHRYFEANNTAYIVMDYVEGESLAAVLKKHGTLAPPQWRRWIEPLLDGLEHVHRRDYLHRDIKPENIVIRAMDGQPVLIDFGAARSAAAEKTRHLTAVHTPGYAPIEQYSASGRQGPATDIYALAAVSYRVLAGEAPPDAADRAVEDEYRPLVQRMRQPGDPFLAAIDRALALRAADRPQSLPAWRTLLNPAADSGKKNTRARHDEAAEEHDPATAYLTEIFAKLGLKQKATKFMGHPLFEVTVRDRTVRIPINRMKEDGTAWDEIKEYMETIVVKHVWRKFTTVVREWKADVESNSVDFKSYADKLDHVQRDFLMCEANMFLLWHANKQPAPAATLWCRGYDMLERMHRCLKVLGIGIDAHRLRNAVVHTSLPEDKKKTTKPAEHFAGKLEEEIELVDREVTGFRVRHMMQQ